MSQPHVLPDSRLPGYRRDFGALMVDWPLPDGTTVRLEAVPIFCANCGKIYGHVPKDNTAFIFWLCRKCYEVHGDIAGTYALPDEEFNRAVQYEMEERFGEVLSEENLSRVLESNRLGAALEKLARESPFPKPRT